MIQILKMAALIQYLKKHDVLARVGKLGEQAKIELEEIQFVNSTNGKGANLILEVDEGKAQTIAAELGRKGINVGTRGGRNLLLSLSYVTKEDEIMALKKALAEI